MGLRKVGEMGVFLGLKRESEGSCFDGLKVYEGRKCRGK